MIVFIERKRKSLPYRILSGFIAFTFVFSLILPPQISFAQVIAPTILNLPIPGSMVPMSNGYMPTMVKGITTHSENPLEFNFIIDTGDTGLRDEELRREAKKLIKYFLASLTTSNDDMWVNLSPYEKDKIVPESFGVTEMGRDMLAQDYILKQLTASMMYPEDNLGREFWDRVYSKAQALYGTTEIPMNTFNKIWIVPQKAYVYEHNNSAFVVDAHLKVMLEEDYVALQNNLGNEKFGTDVIDQPEAEVISGVTSEIVREVLVPEIEKEVNEGKNFAQLRQIYNSLILATWYKQNLRESLLGQVYIDKNKVRGIDVEDRQIKEKIYAQYIEAFKKGVYDYIKEEYDPSTQMVIPRKYFSGGLGFEATDTVLFSSPNFGDFGGSTLPASLDEGAFNFTIRLDELGANATTSMSSDELGQMIESYEESRQGTEILEMSTADTSTSDSAMSEEEQRETAVTYLLENSPFNTKIGKVSVIRGRDSLIIMHGELAKNTFPLEGDHITIFSGFVRAANLNDLYTQDRQTMGQLEEASAAISSGVDFAQADDLSGLAELNVTESGLATIVIKSDKGLNALTDRHLDRLIGLVEQASKDDNVKALVFDGGENFSIGADVYEILRNSINDKAKAIEFYAKEKELHEKIMALSKPTVTLARGYLIGGGLGIAAATDFIITDETTKISMPEVKIGFFPDVGATWFLPRRMGTAAGKYYGLTGATMNGREAVGLGLAQGYVENIDSFKEVLETKMAELKGTPSEVLGHFIRGKVADVDDFAEEVKDLKADIKKHFNYGQHNQGYLGDIYKSLEEAAREGDVFAQKALASMRSANAQSIWLSEFLIDTFSSEREVFVLPRNNDESYTQEEARKVELKLAQEMTGTIHYLEGVLGLKNGFVSGKFSSHLDQIVLRDYSGFRIEIEADRSATGSFLRSDNVVTYERKDIKGDVVEERNFVLEAGEYHAGLKKVTLQAADGSGDTVDLRIDLRNSQWSDSQVVDDLGVIRAFMETKMGWRIMRRAFLANPEKFELDNMIYPYAWTKRPSVSLDLSNHPSDIRYADGEINPARAIFDNLREIDPKLLDERKIIRIGQEQDGDGNNTDVVEYTYRKVEEDANKMANVLEDMGVQKGDLILIYMSTNYETMIAQLAATLAGATYHVQFAAKGSDIFSDNIHSMGAKVIITEDGYQIGPGKSKQLKRDNVDPVLKRYMPKGEFENRLDSALSQLGEELAQESRIIRDNIRERLATKVTYSRDAMNEFLSDINNEHINNVVLLALSDEQKAALKIAQKSRIKAINKANRRINSAKDAQEAFNTHRDDLVLALGNILTLQEMDNVGEKVLLAQLLIQNWRAVLDEIDQEGRVNIEFRERDWIKKHLRSIVNGDELPARESLLSEEDLLSDTKFVVQFARGQGISEEDLISIEQFGKVRDAIVDEFEVPYERDEKVIVLNRLEKLGLIEKAPITEGRDILWDEAIKQTEDKLIEEGKNINEFEAVSMKGSDPLFFVTSSGSTGAPKLIVSLVGAAVFGGQTMRNAFGLAEHDLHHTATDYGWIVGPSYILWFPMMEGRNFTLQAFAPTPDRLAQVVQEYKADFLKAGSPVIELMTKEEGLFDRWDVSTLNREGAPGCYGCAAPYTYPTHASVRATIGDIANNGVWRSEDFGAQHATFKRRPTVEARSAQLFDEQIRDLLGVKESLKVVEALREPIHINEKHPDQLAFPWVTPIISDPLEDSEGNFVEDPQLKWSGLIEGGRQVTETADIGQLSYAGVAGQRMVALMASNEGIRKPVEFDYALTKKKYFDHNLKVYFPGKGRDGYKTAHDGGDSAYWVNVFYDENDPFDALILDGKADPVTPRTLYASGRSGNVANVNGHLVNETMYENVINDISGVAKSGVTFIDHAAREKTPVVVIALKPNIQPSQDLVDEVLRATGNINSAVKPLPQDIIFLPAGSDSASVDDFTRDETYLPMTLTSKIMYELIKYLASQNLETLQQMQEILNDEDMIEAIRSGKMDVFKQHEVFKGLPNVDGLKAKASIIYLLNRVIATREGEQILIAEFDKEADRFDPYANVPEDQIVRLGSSDALRPGIDKAKPFQEAFGITRNTQGIRIVGEPGYAMRKFIRPTPTIASGRRQGLSAPVVVRMLGAGNTYNVINGIMDDPANVILEKLLHVLGDAGFGVIWELSQEAEQMGRLAVGQLVLLDPEVINRHASTVTLNAEREGHIGGYQGGGDQATFQAFTVFEEGNLIEFPAKTSIALASTLHLNLGTVERALYNKEKLNVRPGDVVLIHAASGDTGSLGLEMLEALEDISVITYARDEATAQLIREKHPNVADRIHFILRSEHKDAMTPAPVDDPEALEQWTEAVYRMIDSVPENFRPNKIMSYLGSNQFAADFRLVKPSTQGSRIVWFSGAFGLYGTLPLYDAEIDAQTALGEEGVDVELGENILIHYGADANNQGRDEKAIAAMEEAARLGGHVAVLTETYEQQMYIQNQSELAKIIGKNRVVSVEALQKGEGKVKLQWPDHLPNIDEGRWNEERKPHEPWPGLEAETKYTTQTVSVVKGALRKFTTNANGLWDVIWDNGKRDHMQLNVSIRQDQTGRVVLGKTSSDMIQTFNLARVWMNEGKIIVPSERSNDPTTSTKEKMIHLIGSHMYEPHEARRAIDKMERGLYNFSEPTEVMDADQIPEAFQAQLKGEIKGSIAFRLASGVDGKALDTITTDREFLLAQGAKIEREESYMRFYTQEVDEGKKVATVEFKLLGDKRSGSLRNQDLHWFRGDAVKQLRKLMALAAKDPDIKSIVLTAESTRAFNPGQNSDELATMSPEEIEEMAAAAQEAMSYIESMNKPVVLDLNGLALGGGSELAASAHYIVASHIDRTFLGQPETYINLVPGFGGTQRLVRIMSDNSRISQKAGLLYGVDTVITGQPIPLNEAYMHGLISELVPANSRVRAYELAVGHAQGTDNTLQLAMEKRLQQVDQWEEPMIDQETQRPINTSVITEDEYIKGYLEHGATLGRRGDVYDLVMDLVLENITNGVNYGEEAYAFGQAGSSSEFRASIARFRARVPIERPNRRPKSLEELNALFEIDRKVSRDAAQTDSLEQTVEFLQRRGPWDAINNGDTEARGKISIEPAGTKVKVMLTREGAGPVQMATVDKSGKHEAFIERFITAIEDNNWNLRVPAKYTIESFTPQTDAAMVDQKAVEFLTGRRWNVYEMNPPISDTQTNIEAIEDSVSVTVDGSQIKVTSNNSGVEIVSFNIEDEALDVLIKFQAALGEKGYLLSKDDATALLEYSFNKYKKQFGPIDYSQFKGKVVFITGAGGGLGKDIAFAMGRAGLHVVTIGRTRSKLEKTKAEFERAEDIDTTFNFVVGDVGNNDDLRAAYELADNKSVELGFDGLEYIINNAGTSGPVKMLLENTMEEYEETIRIHGHDWKMSALQKESMLKREKQGKKGRGVIATVGSFFSMETLYRAFPYLFRGPYTDGQSAKSPQTRLGARAKSVSNLVEFMVLPGPFAGERIFNVVYPLGEYARWRIGLEVSAESIQEKTRGMHPQGKFVESRILAEIILFGMADKVAQTINGDILPMGGIEYATSPAFMAPSEYGLEPNLKDKQVILMGEKGSHEKMKAVAVGLAQLGSKVIIGTDQADELRALLEDNDNVEVNEVDVNSDSEVLEFFEQAEYFDHFVPFAGDPTATSSFYDLTLEQIDDLRNRHRLVLARMLKYAQHKIVFKSIEEIGIDDKRVRTIDDFLDFLERKVTKEHFSSDEKEKIKEIIFGILPYSGKDLLQFVELLQQYWNDDSQWVKWTDAERELILKGIEHIKARLSKTELELIERLEFGIKQVRTVEEREIFSRALRNAKGRITVVGTDYTPKETYKKDESERLRSDMFRIPQAALVTSVAAELRMATQTKSNSGIRLNLVLPGNIISGQGNPANLTRMIQYMVSGRSLDKHGAVYAPDEFNAAKDWQRNEALKDRITLVTGGERNMGASIARKLAEVGSEVVTAARSDLGTAKGIKEEGGKATFVEADLMDSEQIKKLTDELTRLANEASRQIDLVNNSGVAGGFFTTGNIPTKDWEDTMQVNFLAALEIMTRLVPVMRQQGGGTIQQVVTEYARLAYIFRSIYVGSKAALGAVSLALAEKLNKEGIYIHNINPSLIEGPRMDLVLRNNINALRSGEALTDDMITMMTEEVDRLRSEDKSVEEIVATLEAKSEKDIPRDVLKPIAWFWTKIAQSKAEIRQEGRSKGWHPRLTKIALYFKYILPLSPPSNDDVGERVAQIAQNPRANAGRDHFVTGLDDADGPTIVPVAPIQLKISDSDQTSLFGKTVLLSATGSDEETQGRILSLINSYTKAGAIKIVVASPLEELTVSVEDEILQHIVNEDVKFLPTDFADEKSLQSVFDGDEFAAAVHVMSDPSEEENFSDFIFDQSINPQTEGLEELTKANQVRAEQFVKKHLTGLMVLFREANQRMVSNTTMAFVTPEDANLEATVSVKTIAELVHVRNMEKSILEKGIRGVIMTPNEDMNEASYDFIVNQTIPTDSASVDDEGPSFRQKIKYLNRGPFIRKKVIRRPVTRRVTIRPDSVDGKRSKDITFNVTTSSPEDEVVKPKKTGGIDFNPEMLDLQIRRDGRGVPLPLPQQPIHNMNIEGFIPVIINVTPVINMPLLLGIADEEESPVDVGFDTEQQPFEARKRIYMRKEDQLSFLN